MKLEIDLLREIIEAVRGASPEARRELVNALALDTTPRHRYVSPRSFAEAQGISVSTVRAAVREQRLPAIRVGRAVRIPVDAKIASARSRAAQSTDPTRDERVARVLGLVKGGRS